MVYDICVTIVSQQLKLPPDTVFGSKHCQEGVGDRTNTSFPKETGVQCETVTVLVTSQHLTFSITLIMFMWGLLCTVVVQRILMVFLSVSLLLTFIGHVQLVGPDHNTLAWQHLRNPFEELSKVGWWINQCLNNFKLNLKTLTRKFTD